MTRIRRAHSITTKQLETLLAYLPLLDPAQTVSQAVVEVVDGVVIHHDTYDNDIQNFLREFREGGFGLSFDWQHWDFQATPQAIAAAGLPNLMKELTRCVQRDRLQPGSFKAACEAGHITTLLRRVQQIYQTMQPEDVVCITYTPA